MSDTLLVIKRDVEGVGSPKRLTELVCADVLPLLPVEQRAKKRIGAFVSSLGGTTIGALTLPEFDDRDWQAHLTEMFDAVAEHLEQEGKALAILWDEAPWMIDKIARDCGWEVAADVLDELRAVRQRHPSIRFLFTGSIGFHHVLRRLRDGKSHQASINDLRVEELPPLRPDDAGRLAWALLRWNADHGQQASDPLSDIAERVALLCEGIPWFIHAAVDDLQTIGGPVRVASVDQVVQAARQSATDGWQLRHYVTRLDDYYGPDARLAEAILDAVAVHGRATPAEILADLEHTAVRADLTMVKDMLRLLHEDHYVVHEPPTWGFSYQLIRQAWLDLRDLSSSEPVPA